VSAAPVSHVLLAAKSSTPAPDSWGGDSGASDTDSDCPIEEVDGFDDDAVESDTPSVAAAAAAASAM
jgi:hypothetical protein